MSSIVVAPVAVDSTLADGGGSAAGGAGASEGGEGTLAATLLGLERRIKTWPGIKESVGRIATLRESGLRPGGIRLETKWSILVCVLLL